MLGDDDFVTDLELFDSMHYLVIATNNGRMLVYKWDRKLPDEIKPMHEFRNHTKSITGLKKMTENRSYIVTSSLDGSIKIFCLEMMIELYSF